MGAIYSGKKSKRVRRAQLGWASGIGSLVVLAAIAIAFAPRMLVELTLIGPFFDPEPQPLSLSASKYVEAITAARTGVLFAAGGVLAAITLYFTRVRDAVAEDKQEDDRARLDLDRDANATERYMKAVAQLGDTHAPVQLGGIYALERLADDSRRDRQTILDVLVAFVRDRAEELPGAPPREAQKRPPVSLDAAVRVVARLTKSSASAHRINWRSRVLAHTDLSDANLGNANFHRTSFNEARLTGARLRGAHIREASFYKANLDGADLRDTQGWMPDQFDDIFSWDDDTFWPDDFDTSRISASRYAARDYAATLDNLRRSQATESPT